MPSLVVRMWADAEIIEGNNVLEIGTGTGYSTALACERLGSGAVTSIEVDSRRLDQAAAALAACGYSPTLAAADGAYGYWPKAPVGRVVVGCSFRSVPRPLIAQVRSGGKILLTLTGWLYGHARVLLTVTGTATAAGRLLPGTISFMPARGHAPPALGNPAHWAPWGTEAAPGSRLARHSPECITAATVQAFHLRFLAQCAAPNAQLAYAGDEIYLIDVVNGSVAGLAPRDEHWHVRESGPTKLWQQIEQILDAYDESGQPDPAEFTLHVSSDGQYIRHPQMPNLALPWT